MSNGQIIPLNVSSSGPSWKGDKIGDKLVGKIVSCVEREAREMDGSVRRFPSGDAMPEWLFGVERADGEQVTLYARRNPKAEVGEGSGLVMMDAIIAAIAAEGGPIEVRIGAELAIAFTGMSKSGTGKNAQRLYTAQYRSPAAVVVDDDLFSS